MSLGITHQGIHIQPPAKENEEVGSCVIFQSTTILGNAILAMCTACRREVFVAHLAFFAIVNMFASTTHFAL